MPEEPTSKYALTLEVVQGGARTALTYTSTDPTEFAARMRDLAGMIHKPGPVMRGSEPRDAFGLAADRSQE